MKITLLFTLFVLSTPVFSQLFTEAYPSIVEEVASNGSVSSWDVNGDSYPDILVTGAEGDRGIPIAKLYLNDGNDNYLEAVDTPFVGVSSSSAAFSDINGDSYPDVLIMGRNSESVPITQLYLNDGNGAFLEAVDTPLEGLYAGTAAFFDVNADSYPDILISGLNSELNPSTKLYINDGSGSFSELADTQFSDVAQNAVAFSDINGDTYPDLLMMGKTLPAATLYINDGSGHFSEVANTPFEEQYVSNGSAVFSDVNGDSYPDILMIGYFPTFGAVLLFINNGNGTFSEGIQTAMDTPSPGGNNGKIEVLDVNGDLSPDVLIAGTGFAGRNTILYINDGMGSFSELSDTPFFEVGSGLIAFSDANNDSYPDVLVIGKTVSGLRSNLYINDGNAHFSAVVNPPFTVVERSTITFSDVNGDSYPDVLIVGRFQSVGGSRIAKLYLNDGNGGFSEVEDTPFEGMEDGDVAFADINGDSYPDVLITGYTHSASTGIVRIAKLYKNNGSGAFSEIVDTPFEGVENSTVAFSDVNGDSYPDVLITGQINSSEGIAKLYINDGEGQFSEVMSTPFEGIRNGIAAFSDVNGDSYPDVLIAGTNNTSERITKLYINDGNGLFSETTDTPFADFGASTASFSDVNGDTYPDVLMIGRVGFAFATKLFTNDGNGSFSEFENTGLVQGVIASTSFSDINGDSYPDLLVMGSFHISGMPISPVTKLYINDGNAHFSEVENTLFPIINGVAEVAFSDVNGDSRPDVLISGPDLIKLYYNEGVISKTQTISGENVLPAKIFPNPSIGQTFNIAVEVENSSMLNISVFDLTGKRHYQESQRVNQGLNTIQLNLGFPTKGMYIVLLENGNYSKLLKLIVQ